MLQKGRAYKATMRTPSTTVEGQTVALIVLQKPCYRKGAMEHNSQELKQESIMVEVTGETSRGS